MKKAACLAFAFAAMTFGAANTHAQTADAPATVSTPVSPLSAVDDSFVAQANLGAPFQIDSGRLAEEKGTTAGIRDYAHLMVVSHVPVVNELNAILLRKNMAAPPNTLLRGAYDAMVASLKADRGAAFDRDYVDGQVEYQKGNTALFQYEIRNGSDPDLKEFARQTLPKIENHLHRALALAEGDDRNTAERSTRAALTTLLSKRCFNWHCRAGRHAKFRLQTRTLGDGDRLRSSRSHHRYDCLSDACPRIGLVVGRDRSQSK